MAVWRMKARRQLSWAQVAAITMGRTIDVVSVVSVVHSDEVVGVAEDDGKVIGEVVDV